MKTNRLFYFLFATFLTAFSNGEFAELEQHMNARAGYDFTKSADNIKFQIPKGTVGKILSQKKFKSGNYGVEMEILNGDKKGEKVFVYYTSQKPNMKFSKENPLVAKTDAEVKPEVATHARTVVEVTAHRAPAAVPAGAVEAAVQKGVDNLHRLTAPARCLDCEVAMAGRDEVVQNAQFQEAIKAEPLDIENKGVPAGKSYRNATRTGLPYDVRAEGEQGKYGDVTNSPIHGFQFSNESDGKKRDWEFNFENKTRQDLYMRIQDDPKRNVSDIRDTMIYVFPRKQLPQIQVFGKFMNVTLPNGEIVQYDKNTKKIIGGVFSEKPVPEAASMGAVKGSQVTYKGSGVIMRLDGPFTKDLRDKTHARSTGPVVMKGNQTCKLKTEDVFPDQSDSSNFSFKYKDDASFDAFLKNKCGFGLD